MFAGPGYGNPVPQSAARGGGSGPLVARVIFGDSHSRIQMEGGGRHAGRDGAASPAAAAAAATAAAGAAAAATSAAATGASVAAGPSSPSPSFSAAAALSDAGPRPHTPDSVTARSSRLKAESRGGGSTDGDAVGSEGRAALAGAGAGAGAGGVGGSSSGRSRGGGLGGFRWKGSKKSEKKSAFSFSSPSLVSLLGSALEGATGSPRKTGMGRSSSGGRGEAELCSPAASNAAGAQGVGNGSGRREEANGAEAGERLLAPITGFSNLSSFSSHSGTTGVSEESGFSTQESSSMLPTVLDSEEDGHGEEISHRSSGDYCPIVDLNADSYFSCAVGRKRSLARYSLATTDDVVTMLKAISDSYGLGPGFRTA
ncbi:unnamed protein product [Closterium sp. NIES-53]